MAIYTPHVLASGNLTTPATLFEPGELKEIVTQVILANRGVTRTPVLLTWFNGTRDVAIIGNTEIPPTSTMVLDVYLPLVEGNILKGSAPSALVDQLDYTIVGLEAV